jgi:peptidyl-prolyl cis-trans isomerase D
MITWMQKHKKYLVITIWVSTIAFVGAGFVGWGVYDYNTDRAAAVAKVGDRKITVKEFQRAYSNIYGYYNELLEGGLSKEKAKELHLEAVTMQNLINEAMMLNYADELGLIALESEVKQRLINTEAFQKDGKFDKQQYYKVLKGSSITPNEFENAIKKEIILKKVRAILKADPALLELETFCSSFFLSDRIAIDTITMQNSEIYADENELKNFWAQNKRAYMTKKSYELEIIEVPFSNIEVSEDEMKEFFESKKYNYKDGNGKLQDFSAAKEKVKSDLQMKKAKKIALQKYLSLKKGKIKADKKVTVFESDQDFPKEKLKSAKKGEVLKPIKLENRYIVAKLQKMNFPEPMRYEDAKQLAKKDLLSSKKAAFLEAKAKEALKNFKGKDIGFVSRDDIKKIKVLNELEAAEFLNHLFQNREKKGYKIIGEKAVLYKILEQKLLDKDKLKNYKEFLADNIKKLKDDEIAQNLIVSLKNRYKIEQYYKGQ